MSDLRGPASDAGFEIRRFDRDDQSAVETVYSDAFADEDLLPLVRQLLEAGQPVFSFVAASPAEVFGHIVFTVCTVEGCNHSVALLGPLAVATEWQRKGVGRALIGFGLDLMQREQMARVLVLGDPAYYGRFGFRKETEIMPPFELPAEWDGAWQSISLAEGGDCRGVLVVPEPWRDARLWSA